MKSLLCSVFALSALVACADIKIGTVDMMVLVRNHPQYESNRKLLTDTEKDYQKKLEKIKDELEDIQEEGRKQAEQLNSPLINASKKQEIEKGLAVIQDKFMAGQQRLRNEAMRSQQELQDLEGRLLKTTTDDLRVKIEQFAKTSAYDFVFDSSAVPFAKAQYDVTDGVLKTMGIDPAKAKKGPIDAGK